MENKTPERRGMDAELECTPGLVAIGQWKGNGVVPRCRQTKNAASSENSRGERLRRDDAKNAGETAPRRQEGSTSV